MKVDQSLTQTIDLIPGERSKYKGKTIVAVEAENCEECMFFTKDRCCAVKKTGRHPKCMAESNRGKKCIIYKEE